MVNDSKPDDRTSGPAFVAGATGYTGREVVRIMAERGVETIAHVRPDSPRLDEWKGKFESMKAKVDVTPWEENALLEACKRIKPSIIFALLGTTRSRMKKEGRAGGDPRTQSYEAVDYGLTAMLVDAAIGAPIKTVFVYLSAMGAQGKNPSAYFKARRKAEKAIMESGLPYVIARPSFIVGPENRDDRRPAENIGAAISDSLLKLAGALGAKKLRNNYLSITNTDLAEVLVETALDRSSGNTILEASDIQRIAKR